MSNFSAWVTRPERQKGAKDKVKWPEGPPAGSRDPESPYTSTITSTFPESNKFQPPSLETSYREIVRSLKVI